MQYVSQLIGTRLRDSNGAAVGTVRDLVVPLGDDYPTVEAVAVKTPNGERFVPWSQVQILRDGNLALRQDADRAEPYAPGPERLSLARQVLDRQIIDVNGHRVVRVNDLQLAEADGAYRLVGVDVSTAGLLRRLGATRVLDRFGVHPVPRSVPWADVAPLGDGDGVQLRVSREDLSHLHPSDLADIISQLSHRQGQEVLSGLDDEFAADAMEEIDRDLQVKLVRGMDAERAADILEEMDPDDAADLLGELEPEHAQDLLSRMERDEAEDVRELLTYDDEHAGGLMTTDFVSVPPEVTAGEAIALVRQQAAAMDEVYLIYVVDLEEHLLGALSLRELIVADPDTPIGRVMHRELIRGHVDDSREEVARLVAKYNLLALPIVDDTGRIRGIVTVDDAMDVILPDDWKARVPRIFRRG